MGDLRGVQESGSLVAVESTEKHSVSRAGNKIPNIAASRERRHGEPICLACLSPGGEVGCAFHCGFTIEEHPCADALRDGRVLVGYDCDLVEFLIQPELDFSGHECLPLAHGRMKAAHFGVCAERQK